MTEHHQKYSFSLYGFVALLALCIALFGALFPNLLYVITFILTMSFIAYQFPFFGLALNFNGSYIFTFVFGLAEIEGGLLLAMRFVLIIGLIRLYTEDYYYFHSIQKTNILLVFLGVLWVFLALSYSNHVQYGLIKSLRFLAMNTFVFIIPLYMKWTRESLISLLKSIAIIGAIGGWVSLIFILFNGLDLAERYSIVEQVNVIWISRAMGISFLAIVGLYMLKQVDIVVLFLFISLPSIFSAMLLSGSRGPLLALFIAVFLMVLFAEKRPQSTLVGLFVGFILLSLGATALLYFNSSSIRLLTDPTNLSSDVSALHRVIAWYRSIELIGKNPILGIGTGGFLGIGNELFPWLPNNVYGYPHNIFLEVFVEYGLVGFVIIFSPFIRIIGWGSGINRKSNFVDQSIVMGLGAFALINAQVGGDMTMNETLWYSGGLLAALNADTLKSEYYGSNNHEVQNSTETDKT